MNYNRVILGGRLTRDPELRYTQTGTSLCTFGVAVSRKWKDKEETCFVDCTAWGNTAETIRKFIRKGQAILIEGRLKLDQWEGHDGAKRSKLSVVVDSFSFVGSKKDAASDNAQPETGDVPY